MMPEQPLVMRTELRPGDEHVVRDIVASTGFFSTAEQEIAVELVQERRARGVESCYHFVFLDVGGHTLGYTCYGPIPATASSYDLYWIAVAATARRQGLGRQLLAATEGEVRNLGGTRIYIDTSSRPGYQPTRAFYRSAGYHEAARLPAFYAPDDGKIIYCKVLGS